MSTFETASISQAYRRTCEDRFAVIESADRTMIVVADGAGGMGQGGEAASAVVAEVRASHAAARMPTPGAGCFNKPICGCPAASPRRSS